MRADPTPEQIEESRRRLNIDPTWEWSHCQAGCGEIVWHPPVDESDTTSTIFVCSAACVMHDLSGRTDRVNIEDVAGAKFISEVYLGQLWSRFLPAQALSIFSTLGVRPLTKVELGDAMDTGWDEPVYPGPELCTVDDIQPGEDVEQVNAEEAQLYQEQIERFDRQVTGIGMQPVRTMADLLTLLVRVGLIVESEDDGVTRYGLTTDKPSPLDAFPLSPEDRAEETRNLWRHEYAPIAQRLINLFEPDAPVRPDRIKTSLQRLAGRLNLDAETVRQGVILLAEDSDFSTSKDVSTLSEHQVFEIVVDWDVFAEERLHITFPQLNG